MTKRYNTPPYHRLGSLSEATAARKRLSRRIERQEQLLLEDWQQVGTLFRTFTRLGSVIRDFTHSSNLLNGLDWGVKLASHLFGKR